MVAVDCLYLGIKNQKITSYTFTFGEIHKSNSISVFKEGILNGKIAVKNDFLHNLVKKMQILI